jgi:anti-sigma regulatory factor (Ser/Thr protein kinase)
LPESLPDLPGWKFEVFYRPAELLSADFYDFIPLADGRLGISIGDVAGKGPDSALHMARMSNLLRLAAQDCDGNPAQALAKVNDLLCGDDQPKRFVTCFFAVLDTRSGKVIFANAGHHPPFVRRGGTHVQVDEFQASGYPLGIFPGSEYDAAEASLAPGDSLVFTSDGFLEARDEGGLLWGSAGLRQALARFSGDQSLVRFVRDELRRFSGLGWQQEDDMTLLHLHWMASDERHLRDIPNFSSPPDQELLADLAYPSLPGAERLAVQAVERLLQDCGLPADRQDDLLTAVLETVANAIHAGNHDQAELPVEVKVWRREDKLIVQVLDSITGALLTTQPGEGTEAVVLAEEFHGWGAFIAQHLVDEMYVSLDEDYHSIELVLYL